MKFLVYLVILIFILRWISQAFKPNITYININQSREPKKDKEPGEVKITGDVKTKTKGNIGDYVDYEEI